MQNNLFILLGYQIELFRSGEYAIRPGDLKEYLLWSLERLDINVISLCVDYNGDSELSVSAFLREYSKHKEIKLVIDGPHITQAHSRMKALFLAGTRRLRRAGPYNSVILINGLQIFGFLL